MANESAPTKRDAAGHRRPDLDALYCINPDGSRNTIHTADVRGRYQVRKKVIWAVLIAIYLVVPWIEVGGHPAVQIDIERRHFFLFGSTFNAQDFWLAFFVVSGVGFALFVVSALYGRVWCGYACPHTVFLEGVFRRVERWLEGGATQRKRLAEQGWNARKIAVRGTKWAIYLAISLVLSHTMLAYFMSMDTVLAATTHSPAEHSTAFVFVLVLTAIIYFNFTWFREQLCIVICPYGRLQGVLYDEDTVNVGYDEKRGEPRGKYHADIRGDCIDCYRCVAVCPTGIDIRNGTQLECVGCANCIDACDEVMTKVGQPTGLIRYDSQRGFEGGGRKFWRPRVAFYAALLAVGVGVFAFAASGRYPFEAHAVREKGALYAESEKGLRNGFFLHLINKESVARTFRIEPVASPGVEFVAPLREVTIEGLADTRVPVSVIVAPEAFEHGMTAAVDVAVGEAVRRVELRVAGPLR